MTNKFSKLVIVGCLMVGLLAALGFSFLKPVTYDTSISFSINRINRQETAEYQYDGYYAIQASDLFSQTVMSWFMTPSVLLEIYDQAQIDPQIQSLTDLTSRFKTKKYSPQNIVVKYSERDQETATKIAAAIVTVIEKKSTDANQTSDQKALFDVQGAKPVIVQNKPILWLNTAIGIIAGLLVGFSLAYLLAFLRERNVKPQL
jgi:capsular polysaccharide biosynthesis protein